MTFPKKLLALSFHCIVSTFEAACKLGPQYLVTAIRRVKDTLLEDAEQVTKNIRHAGFEGGSSAG